MSNVTKLDWIEPEIAFSGLRDTRGALLLHGGRQTASRLYALPDSLPVFDGSSRFSDFQTEMRSTLKPDRQIAGLFGYELSHVYEPTVKGHATRWPLVALGVYPAWAVFDPVAKQVSVFGSPAARARLIANFRKAPSGSVRSDATLKPAWSQEAYMAACSKLIEHIRVGDIYQANLSQRFSGHFSGDPWSVFGRLIERSDAPHAAYFRLDDNRIIISNSPERFLKMENGQVESRPIKGTRPRSDDPSVDTAMRDQLEHSAKDRAENLMIVDLVRHDLARVCHPGSVKVPSLNVVESFANVHHLVSRVTGQVKEPYDGLDVIAAAFPPGSITGAPKIRAMQLIAEAEGEARGPYCGALGWIGEGGQTMDLNVMIRTLTFERREAGWDITARSGGAITIDSDPQSEYEETLHKLSALRRALEAQ